MFNKETVFLTGAGASVHYGYPTGAELIQKVRMTASMLAPFYETMSEVGYGNPTRYVDDRFSTIPNIRERYKQAALEIREFIRRLNQTDPVVIDYFLGQNMQFEGLGKLLIAWVILEVESRQPPSNGNYIRWIVHQIAVGCKTSDGLLENKVKFLSFNYDTTLERNMRDSLRGLSLFDETDIDSFITHMRFQHIYGSVNDGNSKYIDFSGIFTGPHSISQTLIRTIEIADQVYSASKNLLVIDPENKSVPDDVLERIHAALRSAEFLVVLGFGFDRYNTELIQLRQFVQTGTVRDIFVTNFNNISRINQAIGKTFLDDRESLEGPYTKIGIGRSIRKSTLDTNGALSSDFDLDF